MTNNLTILNHCYPERSEGSLIEMKFSRKITAHKAQTILEENGLPVTTDQAKAITEFLYKLAQTTTRMKKTLLLFLLLTPLSLWNEAAAQTIYTISIDTSININTVVRDFTLPANKELVVEVRIEKISGMPFGTARLYQGDGKTWFLLDSISIRNNIYSFKKTHVWTNINSKFKVVYYLDQVSLQVSRLIISYKK